MAVASGDFMEAVRRTTKRLLLGAAAAAAAGRPIAQ
jgi:hypothetical protein